MFSRVPVGKGKELPRCCMMEDFMQDFALDVRRVETLEFTGSRHFGAEIKVVAKVNITVLQLGICWYCIDQRMPDRTKLGSKAITWSTSFTSDKPESADASAPPSPTLKPGPSQQGSKQLVGETRWGFVIRNQYESNEQPHTIFLTSTVNCLDEHFREVPWHAYCYCYVTWLIKKMYASMSRAPAGKLKSSDWSISSHERDTPSKPTHTRPL